MFHYIIPSNVKDNLQKSLQQREAMQVNNPDNQSFQAMKGAQIQKTQAQAAKEQALANQHMLENQEKEIVLKAQEETKQAVDNILNSGI